MSLSTWQALAAWHDGKAAEYATTRPEVATIHRMSAQRVREVAKSAEWAQRKAFSSGFVQGKHHNGTDEEADRDMVDALDRYVATSGK